MLYAMFHAMLAVLVAWLALGVAFVGIGRWVLRAVGRGATLFDTGSEEFPIAFWLGWCVVLGFLQFWNFWLPIGPWALACVIIAGLTGLVTDRTWWGRQLGHFLGWRTTPEDRTRRRRVLIGRLLVVVWLSNRVLGSGNADDSGLYHYNVIRWANEYPVVPGLGNLNAAFALNNASFLYHAMLNTANWAGRGNHLGNGLLLLFFFCRIVASMGRLLDRKTPCRPVHVFDVVLLPAAMMLALGKDLPSPKTDLPPGLLLLLMVRTLIAVWLERRGPTRGR